MLANDTNPNPGDTLRVIAVNGTTLLGTVAIAPAGQGVVYTPAASFQALAAGEIHQESFIYTIANGAGATATATTTVTVVGANDAPTVLAAVQGGVNESSGTFTLNLLQNASDIDHGATLHAANVVWSEAPGNLPAGFSISGNSIVVDTNSPAYDGMAQGEIFNTHFTYDLVDEHGALVHQAATLTIAGTNDGPVAVADSNAGDPVVESGVVPAGFVSIDLDDVAAGLGGFKVIGENAGDLMGFSVAGLGDVNGDGRPDLLVGAAGSDTGGSDSGASYVVFGKADGAAINLDDVALGIGGFKIVGENGDDQSGFVAGLGDVNGDGRADLLVGAPLNDAAGGDSGAAYVVFGKADGTAVNLDGVALGIGGFKIIGENAGDRAGGGSDSKPVAGLGDVNGDGRADLLVGAIGNDAGGSDSGAAYVVFGKADGTAVNLDDVALGIGGFNIIGENAGDLAGMSVAGLGDLNGDGRVDLLVGAIFNDAGGVDSGAAYVVFGKADGTPVDLDAVAAGIGGFKIIGENADDFAGREVASLGDVNGDGRADLLIGAIFNDAGGSNSGAAYVVFGKADGTAVNLDDVALGIGGFKIIGQNAGDLAGESISGLGDINGDGRADLLIGAEGANATYVVYGTADGTPVKLDDVALGIGGFKIDGGARVSGLGDMNGDGRADLLIGAPVDNAGGTNSGAAYVVFGPPSQVPFPGDPSATGNVLTNDTDVDAGDGKMVVGVQAGTVGGPVAGNVGTAITGTYGMLMLQADGNYSYALDNSDPDTSALAQGETALDVFTYTMADTAGAASSSTLTIDIAGTHDGWLLG